MKTKLIIVFFTVILFSGCIKDTLDRKPLNMISDSDVWVSERMVDLYMVTLYDNIMVGHQNSNINTYESTYTDESAYHGYNNTSGFGNSAIAVNTTMYNYIRKVNTALGRLKTATIAESSAKIRTAECRFIRAYYYFQLVKRYGGMPIIQDVQLFDNNLDALQLPRNKEEELYDFILNELDEAMADLPDAWDANNANRATKLVAQALKSRVALYAGSIAKYGTVQLNGLIGIPASKANTYFTQSMNASRVVMESGKFGLYVKLYDPVSKSGDPSANYTQIFLDRNHNEVIFQKAYSYPDKVHGIDHKLVPEGFTTNYGSQISPYLELAEAYEYIDGTPGIFNVEGKEFNTPDDLFKDKDPRFAATIFRLGTPHVGRAIDIYKGIYDTDGTLYSTVKVPFPKDPSRMQVGKDGPFEQGNGTRTGFYIRKFLSLSEIIVASGLSSQNYIDIRYAEILLNYAEAGIETGTDLPGALDAINKVRNRAGIKLLDASELTIDRLRNERRVELAFEDKRFWDMRRWRIGASLFRNTYMHGLYPYLKYTGTGYKYIYKKISGYPLDAGFTKIWEEKDYYSNLSGYISTNKNIENNPGW